MPSFYTKTTEYSSTLVRCFKKQIKIFFIVSKYFFRHNFSTIRILSPWTIVTVQVERLIVVLLIYVYIMYAHAIHSFGSMADRRPRLEITTSIAKRIGRPQIRGIDERFAFSTPSPVKGKECRESVSRFNDTWFQETQLGRRCVRVVLSAAYSGTTGPQSFLFRERVRQPDTTVSGLASGRRKLLHHYRCVRVHRRQGPSALFHGRGSDTMEKNASTGCYLDVFRQLWEFYVVWK